MKQTQCQKILRHLEDHGSITTLDAFRDYGILRLASRMNDLKREGYSIKSEIMTGENRYGEKVRYSVYTLNKGE